jgi:hypothetical protein
MIKVRKSGRDNSNPKGVKQMGKNSDCDDLDAAALKASLDEANTKIQKLEADLNTATAGKTEAEKKAKDATDELTKYQEAEKTALVDSISKRSDFKAEDLAKKTVDELRTIHLAIDHVKVEGTVKNVRGAGDSTPIKAPNITADGKIDTRVSVMGQPVKQADGTIKWVVGKE